MLAKNGKSMSTNDSLKVVCWKWHKHNPDKLNEYTAEHVNRFASMIRRNLFMPYELVCITDDPEGIDVDIRIIPIWDDLAQYDMCFRRLRAFSSEMKDIIGPRFVSMDLDCVILNDITSLFDNSNEFMIWKSETKGAPYCGSMWMMNAGSREFVWKKFREKDLIQVDKNFGRQWINKHAYNSGWKVGSDQSWLNYELYTDEKVWTKEDGVYNFRNHIYKKYRTMPDMSRAKIVFFNGKHDPSDAELQKEYPWIKENWR